jgi:hypothetical protein
MVIKLQSLLTIFVLSSQAALARENQVLDVAWELYIKAVDVAQKHANHDGSFNETGRLEALGLVRQSIRLVEAVEPIPVQPFISIADVLVDLLTARSAPVGSSSQLSAHHYNFLHLPKTGGTSVVNAAHECVGSVVTHGHDITLADLTRQELPRSDTEIVALVRDPADRFLSSFVFFKEGGYRGAHLRRSDSQAVQEASEALALQERVVQLLDSGAATAAVPTDQLASALRRLASLTWAHTGDPQTALVLVRRATALLLPADSGAAGRGDGGERSRAESVLRALEMTASHPIHAFATAGDLVDAMRNQGSKSRKKITSEEACEKNASTGCEKGHPKTSLADDGDGAVVDPKAAKAWAVVVCQENMLHIREEDAEACRLAGSESVEEKEGGILDPTSFHLAFRSQSWWLKDDDDDDDDDEVDSGGVENQDSAKALKRHRLRILPFESLQQCSSQADMAAPTLASCLGFHGCDAPLPHLNGRSSSSYSSPSFSLHNNRARNQVLTESQAAWVREELYPDDSALHKCVLGLASESGQLPMVHAPVDHDRHWECVKLSLAKRITRKQKLRFSPSQEQGPSEITGVDDETWL